MAKHEFNIGAHVHCRDGDCGRLHKVALDPHTRRVTDLIVARGFLVTTDRVLPVEAVQRATGQDVYLTVDSHELANYPEYRVIEFEEPAPSVQDGSFDPNDVRCWKIGYRVACTRPVVPMVHRRIEHGLADQEVAIERGTPVTNKEGTVGEVDHLLIDSESGALTHIVIRMSQLPYYPILPVSEVKRLSQEGIVVSPSDEELSALPHFRRRAAEDIEAELRDRLRESSLDLGQVEIVVEGDVVTLLGGVATVQAKRRAEAIARSVEGVVDVQNELETEVAVRTRVLNALLSDPRTALSTIEVRNESGLVTLRGRVDRTEVKAAAQEIAADQPGVLSVVDTLQVEADEDTDRLQARWLSAFMMPNRRP